jgi:hypothetical protein
MGEPILPDFDYTARERTQHSIERSTLERVNPVGNKVTKDNPVQFNIEASDLYTSLHDTELHVTCKVTATDGSDLANNAVVSVTNLLFHTLWKTIEIRLNGNETETVSDYPFGAYLQTLLEYDSDVLEKRGSLVGWSKDTAGKMDVFTPVLASENTGAKGRSQASSPVSRMIGKLFTDVRTQRRSIPPGTKILITLTPSSDAFVLGTANDGDQKVEIMDAHLMVARQRVSKQLALSHKSMTAKHPLRLHTRQVRISKHIINVGVGEVTIRSLFNAPPGVTHLPDRFLVGFVTNAAVVGNREQNPFNFQPAALRKIEARHGDQVLASYDLNWAVGSKGHLKAYYALLKEFSADDEYNHTLNITPTEFAGGYALYPFRLVPRVLAGASLGEPEVGNVTLDIAFSTPPAAVLTCLVLAEYRGHYDVLPAAATGPQV